MKRNYSLDFLKTLGLLLIILAHTSLPKTSVLFALRTFDVTLMILASGALFTISSQRRGLLPITYMRNRIPRLLFPTWIFLCLFLLSMFGYAQIFETELPISTSKMIAMFFLMDTSYVWIIRVFIIIALISPALLFIKNAVSRHLFTLVAISILLCYSFLFAYLQSLGIIDAISSNKLLYYSVYNILFFALPYGCIFAVGMGLPESKIYETTCTGLLFAVIAVVISVLLPELSLQDSKYPPQLYYLAYGLGMSIFLYSLVTFLNLEAWLESHNWVKASIVAVSTSTLWIYLWHILFVSIFEVIDFGLPWYIQFFLVSFLSIVTSIAQSRLISSTKRRTNDSPFFKALLVYLR